MIKILLKIWPALLIIALYCLWVLLIRKKLVKKSKNDNIVEGEYKIVENEQKNQESSKISTPSKLSGR
jgi:beta-lactamase regulating signal transducer with metallopeptidase domain